MTQTPRSPQSLNQTTSFERNINVWLVTVIALFGIVEFFQWTSRLHWLEQIALLPTPILFAAGLGLAIASNAKKHLPWQSWASSASTLPQPNSADRSPANPTQSKP